MRNDVVIIVILWNTGKKGADYIRELALYNNIIYKMLYILRDSRVGADLHKISVFASYGTYFLSRICWYFSVTN